MSVEAFLWCYKLGENSSIPLNDVLAVFQPHTRSFDAESGILHLQFDNPDDSCDIYLGGRAAERGATSGLSISRPPTDSRLWECVLEILRLGNVILFFSDDTTPLFVLSDALSHFPPELLQSLGVPRQVATTQDILASRD